MDISPPRLKVLPSRIHPLFNRPFKRWVAKGATRGESCAVEQLNIPFWFSLRFRTGASRQNTHMYIIYIYIHIYTRVWLNIKQEGLRRFWSICPLTRVPFWDRFFEPQPYDSYPAFKLRRPAFFFGALSLSPMAIETRVPGGCGPGSSVCLLRATCGGSPNGGHKRTLQASGGAEQLPFVVCRE